MQGSSVLSIASLDLSVKLPDILKTCPDYQENLNLNSHLNKLIVTLPSTVDRFYLNEHEVVEAAVHHEPQ